MNQVVVKQEKSGYQIVEAYKSLRTNLQFCGEDKKVIAVTSCTPNEGKSSVSMQLGISLAESGKRVILIDADLRKSVLLGRTKTQKSVRGLAHFLSGQATLEDVICSTNVKNFYMIYSGPFPPNPARPGPWIRPARWLKRPSSLHSGLHNLVQDMNIPAAFIHVRCCWSKFGVGSTSATAARWMSISAGCAKKLRPIPPIRRTY